VLQLAHQNGVAQVQIRGGRVKPRLHPERAAILAGSFQALPQIRDANDLGCALLEIVQLFVYWQKVHVFRSIRFHAQ
jgi:hypothetical protein